MIEDGAAALLGGIGLLERAVNYTFGSLHLVRQEHLARPTPCRDWNLETLLGHMNDSLLALHEAADIGRIELFAPDVAAEDPITALRDRARLLLGAWTDGPETVSIGGNQLTTSILTSAGAVEIAVHGWDVAQACGLPRPLPGELAEELLELAPLFLTMADRPGRFGPAVPVPPTASAGVRLLAFTGRRAA
ncbi:TIGR03086 family metal-binding protein [Amycolatopsis sp.]|uniref:TIGR03086 family metal-binding protein n=1 Tax=Amycolatopsis sp. TaxID=37632 RepID=UPI002BB3A6BC|nr:TIGR03086 family metal-binding protein [Amycolatopsis sp.]HVV13904.1 TIGR03086 family metal-binding protein [Amycolatopsis sp.]